MQPCCPRGSYKTSPGKKCVSGLVRLWAPPPPPPHAPPRRRSTMRGAHYGCQLSQTALDYARRVVLRPWPNTNGRRAATAALVVEELKTEGCAATLGAHDHSQNRCAPVSTAHSPRATAAPQLDTGVGGVPAPAPVRANVATEGSDSTTGTGASPLRSIAGAQMCICAKFSTVSARPRITVLVGQGDYFVGHGSTASSTRHTGTAQAQFSEDDSTSNLYLQTGTGERSKELQPAGPRPCSMSSAGCRPRRLLTNRACVLIARVDTRRRRYLQRHGRR